ncbi:MAG: CpaD family pilus assembly protein [Sphingomonas sp.]|nr:CpaD family pilus assembly protein [Sphingomonas sp.]
MASKSALLLVAFAVAGCGHRPYDIADRGVEAVNVPVVSRSDYVFDAGAPDGSLAPYEAARLNAWFAGLDLGYGDTIYVDGPFAEGARNDVASIAGNYGLMVAHGAPVTTGPVGPGMVRVIVSRTRASVPNCPNWSVPANPNPQNRSMSNFGCSVNANLAAMVADPQDLVHGREGTGVGDAATSAKAVGAYRRSTPTGAKGLQDISTKKGD